MPTVAYIGVGSNLEHRDQNIQKAREAVFAHPAVRFLPSAPIYETLPFEGPPQGLYLNTVWEIETNLSAHELLSLLLTIENRIGRVRLEKNGPRLIDLDVLFFGDEIIQDPNLQVPHPRLQERWFVLKPLWDLRADLVHPILKKSVCELLDEVHENH